MTYEEFLRLVSAQPHPCMWPGCTVEVQYDDEPYCFAHSPDEGSAIPGFSWKASHQ